MPTNILSSYNNPNKLLFNGHLQTIYPALYRKISTTINFKRERITTPDNDFLDIDWYCGNNEKLIIVSHGLEGDSQRPYMLGIAELFNNHNFDVVCWNMRSCSGEINAQKRFYHLGATDDLDTVIKHTLTKKYKSIFLVGFSAGGNLTLKYLGENATKLCPEIKKAATFSVPLHLSDCTQNLAKINNRIYEHRFLKSLKNKIKLKSEFFPDLINWKKINDVKHIWDFDEYITAPLHGFKGAEDYYEKSSSINYIADIQIPTLIINAQNDPFLGKKSFPYHLTKNLKFIHFETPKTGGHCGFYLSQKHYWSELKALDFFTKTDI